MSLLTVKIPPGYQPERKYILDLLLVEFLGLDLDVVPGDVGETVIQGRDGRCCCFTDVFFMLPEESWLTAESLPKSVSWARGIEAVRSASESLPKDIPVLFHAEGEQPTITRQDVLDRPQRIDVRFDLFGTAFFMLSRYEEAVEGERDMHGRYPADASVIIQNSLLERPLVNEYIELLWACVSILWPEMKRKVRDFRIFPTHDVDIPFAYNNWQDVLRRPAGMFARTRSLPRTFRTVARGIQVLTGHKPDPYDTSRMLMNESEQAGRKSAFYFMVDHVNQVLLGDGKLSGTLHAIADRGHEIGFHPGYSAAQDDALWQAELIRLKAASPLPLYGGRQHYLRTIVPDTWQQWDAAGFVYESSFGYVYQPGFRCGICYEYPVFDLKKRKKLNLKERPLILMDRAFFRADGHAGKNMDTAFGKIEKIKKVCKIYHGDFMFLWHNNQELDDPLWDAYRLLVK